MKNRFWERPVVIWAAYTLAALVASFQRLYETWYRSAEKLAISKTAYENYVIFKNAFPHLLSGANPYGAFPAEQWDLYKYSPAFALFMGPFSAMPDALGLPLWNLLNALLPLAAVMALPVLERRHRFFVAWFILPEMITSLQNSQSNGLTLGLLLWAWVALERNRPVGAAGSIMASAFIKVFGLAAAGVALLYPGKIRFSLSLAGWGLFLAMIPLAVLAPAQLSQVYHWWLELLQEDHAMSVGLSVQGWLQSWFGWMPGKMAVLAFGVLVQGLCFVSVMRHNTSVHRALVWATLLLWVVLFNHKAESPTFVIALAGAAIWYTQAQQTRSDTILIGAVFIFASLTPTDVFPRVIREQWVKPYVLKAVPCIVLWALISFRLIRLMVQPARATNT